MRRTTIACILAFGLLLAPALAMAQPNGHAHAKAVEGAVRAEERANKTAEKESHRAQRDNDTGNSTRPAYVTAFLARMHALRESLIENLSDVREGCRPSGADPANLSKEDRRTWAQCVKNGYKAVIERFHEERKDAKEDFRDARKAAQASRRENASRSG